jgi:hypothetical protein
MSSSTALLFRLLCSYSYFRVKVFSIISQFLSRIIVQKDSDNSREKQEFLAEIACFTAFFVGLDYGMYICIMNPVLREEFRARSQNTSVAPDDYPWSWFAARLVQADCAASHGGRDKTTAKRQKHNRLSIRFHIRLKRIGLSLSLTQYYAASPVRYSLRRSNSLALVK